MNASIKKQLEDIKNNIDDLSEYLSKRTAELAREDLEVARKQIIDDFYSYQIKSPKHNKRTWLLKYVVRVDKKVKGSGERHSASMTVNGDAVDTEYGHGSYKVTANYVTDLIWEEGIRGLPESGTRIFSDADSFMWDTPNGRKKYGEGDTWTNPYWDQRKYKNEFLTKLHIGKFNSYKATPDRTMQKFVDQWGKKRMDDVLDIVKEETKNKFNLT